MNVHVHDTECECHTDSHAAALRIRRHDPLCRCDDQDCPQRCDSRDLDCVCGCEEIAKADARGYERGREDERERAWNRGQG